MLSRAMRRVVSRICEDLDTPLSLSVFICLKYGEYAQLAAMATDPSNYLDVPSGIYRYWKDSQAIALLKKNSDLKSPDLQPKDRAIEKWFEAERQCWHTNRRMQCHINNYYVHSIDVAAAPIMERARKILRTWLGRPPDTLEPRMGPGSVYETATLRKPPVWGDKLTISQAVTRRALIPSVLLLKDTVWADVDGFRDRDLDQVNGNRHTTVPKTALTDRSIAVEPGLNLAFQLAIGHHLSKRLARIGLSKDKAQVTHNLLAMRGSRDGSLSTIDLSSASDTVARELVRYLLPEEWFSLLENFRSPKTKVNGKWIVLEKFSSMGNGFTFELETLVFAALIHGVAPGLLPGQHYWVFGDDIIVPPDVYSEVVAILRYSGFELNSSKSFTGPPGFRESCGGDFFCGVAVRPFFSKKSPVSPADWFSFLNGLRRSFGGLIGSPLRRGWILALCQVPLQFRVLRGPVALGDLVIHAPGGRIKWKHCIRYWRCLTPVTRAPVPLARYSSSVQLCLALIGCDSAGQVRRSPPRDHKLTWVPYS